MFRWLELRPVFEIHLRESREVAMQRLAEAFKDFNQPRIFLVHGEYGELHLPVSEHRMWSPHLSFYVTQEENESILRGRFAPRMEIWAFVWVLYLAMAFSAFFALTMEFSMRSIGESAWWHWLALAAILMIVLIYVVANVGQQWSSDQMHKLRGQLEEILSKCQLQSS